MTKWNLFWIGISILSLLLGVKNYFDEQATFARAKQYTATLTEWVRDPHYGSADFCPRYEYTEQNGQTADYIESDCTAHPDDSLVGHQTMQIYVDPTNPHWVETKGWSGSEGSGLILGIIGFVFFSLFWLIPLLVSFFRKGTAPANASR